MGEEQNEREREDGISNRGVTEDVKKEEQNRDRERERKKREEKTKGVKKKNVLDEREGERKVALKGVKREEGTG